MAQTRDEPQFEGDILEARENRVLGIVFGTGESQSGWLLSSVTLDVERWPRGTVPIVSIHRAELRGQPGLPVPTTRIASLDNPWAGKGWRTFTVSSRVQLKPDRYYAIVVESTATTAAGAIELRGTRSSHVDAGSQGGWEIDRITYVAPDATAWSGNSVSASSHSVRFAAHGYDAGEVWREGAKLENLAVTPVTGSVVQFTPSFSPRKRGPYSVWVTNDTNQVTLAAEAESSSARVDMPRDVDPDVEGTQINIPAGTATRHQIRVFDGPSGIFRTYYQLVFKHPGDTLTGTLRKLEPLSSGGTLRYRFALNLSAPVELSLAHLRSYVFALSNGAIVEAKRPVGRAVGPGGDPLGRTWHLTVIPVDAAADTQVTFRTKPSCASTGAVCTVGGLKLDSLASLSFSPADVRSVSIEDTSAGENDGEIVFTASLSRTSERYVYVDFETIDSGAGKGTADPRADYWPQFTRLVIPPGTTSVRAGVALIDDSIDDGESVRVRISNARQVGEGGVFLKPLTIATAEATGTIRNSDAMPRAWLARFGRTVADQVLDAVQGRMSAPLTPGMERRLAGERAGGESATIEGSAAEARIEALSERMRGAGDEDTARPFGSQDMTARELFTGSSFAFTGGTPERGVGAVWGRVAVSHFDGQQGDVSLDGDVVSTLAGADLTRGRTTAGLVVSHSRGQGDFRSPVDGGTAESTLTGLYPWGRHALNDRLSVWGVAGYGAGELVVTPKERLPIATDMDLAMAAAGLRGVLVKAPADGGLELAARSHALVVRTRSAEVRGSAGSLAAAETEVVQLQYGLEGTWTGFGSIEPSLEIGVRQDGGDAETGIGIGIGAGLTWREPAQGIEAEVRARGLVSHDDGKLDERGFAGSFAWDPTPASDRGPALTLRQAVGARANGGVDSLLRPVAAGTLGGADSAAIEQPRRRLETKLGYGFALIDGRYTGTPTLGFSLSDTEREIVLGWRVSEARRAGVAFAVDVEGARRERTAGNAEAGHRLAIGLGWRLERVQPREVDFEGRFEMSRSVAANDEGKAEHGIGLRMTARW